MVAGLRRRLRRLRVQCGAQRIGGHEEVSSGLAVGGVDLVKVALVDGGDGAGKLHFLE